MMLPIKTHMTTTRDTRSRKEKRQAVARDGVSRRTLSFYKYVRINDPEAMQERLFERWQQLGCLGRIYVAHEGINAQMNVPVQLWDQFDAYMKTIPEFRDVPYKIAVEEGESSSFYKLTVKVKDKIVADGLDDQTFDPGNTGAYLTAMEMNALIEDPDAIVVDMRNAYESEIGHFEGAILPQVDTFRDELKLAPELLRVHKNKKIALYCTGGIRCEKASAWLKHHGFENVRHLKGGIIDYKHQVERDGLPNKFRGKNFVFDERLSERIGDEVISTCHLCSKEKSDIHYHCKNQVCHVLFLGCERCLTRKRGYCSRWCGVTDRAPQRLKRWYTRWYNQHFRSGQFKKHRLKSKVT